MAQPSLEIGWLVPFLGQSPLVRALVFSGEDLRVYPGALPQKPTLPAITYRRIGNIPDMAAQGATGLERCRLRLKAFGWTFDDAEELMREIQAELSGASDPLNGIEVQRVSFEHEQHETHEAVNAEALAADLVIWYRRGP